MTLKGRSGTYMYSHRFTNSNQICHEQPKRRDLESTMPPQPKGASALLKFLGPHRYTQHQSDFAWWPS